jgi:hypothetical protein
MISYRRRVLGLLVALMLAPLFVPYKRLIIPAWNIEVVDEHGDPVSGMDVFVAFRDTTFSLQEREIIFTTGLSGRVTVQPRFEWSFLGRDAGGVVVSYMCEGVHASPGRYARVIAASKGCLGSDDDPTTGMSRIWDGTSNQFSSRIIVHARQGVEVW